MTGNAHQSAQEFWDDVRANPNRSAEEFWDGFYTHNTWGDDGPVNRYLISEAEDLPPGLALDLGCGEGGDALWLAARGWTVLAVDVSAIALERVETHASNAGLAERIRVEKHDLGSSFPAGAFDLVSVQFLHSPVARPDERERILRRAAEAVAPGGHLLVVSHAGMPSWMAEQPAEFSLPTPQQTIAAVSAGGGQWETVHEEVVVTELPAPDGQPGTRDDHILHLRQLNTPA